MSMTITGVLAVLLSSIVTPEETDTIISFIDQLILVAGIVAAYWGRYRQGDITWWGARK